MGRVILILMACSVLMLAFAFQTQPQFVWKMLSYYDGSRSSGLPATVQLSEPGKVSAKVPSKRSTPAADVPVVPDTPPVVTPPAVDAVPKSPRVVKVASDSATLYTLNSTKGPIVAVLQKGDIVEPQLEISEGGERWAFVEVAAQHISGFVQTENLERTGR